MKAVKVASLFQCLILTGSANVPQDFYDAFVKQNSCGVRRWGDYQSAESKKDTKTCYCTF